MPSSGPVAQLSVWRGEPFFQVGVQILLGITGGECLGERLAADMLQLDDVL